MLDQNISTIVASIIAVIGTLGGAIAGVLLSNRHTSKMEQLKIDQEKSKRITAIIEEVYMDIYRLNGLVLNNFENHVLVTKGIQEFNRINVLICLYLPPDISDKHVAYTKAIYQFAVDTQDIQDEERKNLELFQQNHPTIVNNYFDTYLDLTNALQRLVK